MVVTPFFPASPQRAVDTVEAFITRVHLGVLAAVEVLEHLTEILELVVLVLVVRGITAAQGFYIRKANRRVVVEEVAQSAGAEQHQTRGLVELVQRRHCLGLASHTRGAVEAMQHHLLARALEVLAAAGLGGMAHRPQQAAQMEQQTEVAVLVEVLADQATAGLGL
jgi:hypothetical protein